MVPERRFRHRRDSHASTRRPPALGATTVPASPTPVAGHCACGGECTRCGSEGAGRSAVAGNGSTPPATTATPPPAPEPAAPASTPPETQQPRPAGADGSCVTGQPRTWQKLHEREDIHAPRYEFAFKEVNSPCLSCPNSPENACPKEGDTSLTPRTATPVQYSWQARMTAVPAPYKNRLPRPRTHVVQKIESAVSFTTGGDDFQACGSPYWEAFELDANGSTAVDYWQAELPHGSAGTWSVKGTCYLTDGLPAGMEVRADSCAAALPSTTQEPRKLGRVVGERGFSGNFDFTGTAMRHR